jgi:arsenate reductase
VIAECIMNRLGQGKFQGFSAGSAPRGEIHPYALDLLRHNSYDTGGLRSKSWLEFAREGAPEMDFIFTVCDDAAGEVCPIWPGQPMTAHWGLPDPSRADGTEAEKRLAFADAHRMLYQRISVFVNLPIAALDRLVLQKSIDDIGEKVRIAAEKA